MQQQIQPSGNMHGQASSMPRNSGLLDKFMDNDQIASILCDLIQYLYNVLVQINLNQIKSIQWTNLNGAHLS